MNTVELKVEMVRFGDTDASLAEFIGISRPAFISKKTGKSEFKLSEIKAIATRYTLSPDRVMEIFLP